MPRPSKLQDHALRDDVEKLLAEGAPLSAIAEFAGVSLSTAKHWSADGLPASAYTDQRSLSVSLRPQSAPDAAALRAMAMFAAMAALADMQAGGLAAYSAGLLREARLSFEAAARLDPAAGDRPVDDGGLLAVLGTLTGFAVNLARATPGIMALGLEHIAAAETSEPARLLAETARTVERDKSKQRTLKRNTADAARIAEKALAAAEAAALEEEEEGLDEDERAERRSVAEAAAAAAEDARKAAEAAAEAERRARQDAAGEQAEPDAAEGPAEEPAAEPGGWTPPPAPSPPPGSAPDLEELAENRASENVGLVLTPVDLSAVHQ